MEPKAKRRIVLIAEFSIHHIGAGTSVGRYVKAAVRAMSRIPGLTFDIAPMSSVLEAENIGTILEAVEVSHRILRSMGAKRISSSLRIDERLDKRRMMSDKTRGLKRLTSARPSQAAFHRKHSRVARIKSRPPFFSEGSRQLEAFWASLAF